MVEVFEPKIVAFCCDWCSYAAADLAGVTRLQYPVNIKIIRIPCTGRIDPLYILKAFENGADGVYVAGCLEGECHYLTGNFRAKNRVEYTKKLLEEVGIEQERLAMYNLSASMAKEFIKITEEVVEKIKKLGPNPIKK
jgi:coenzyme F420-reducing hydrogenase delta subunit